MGAIPIQMGEGEWLGRLGLDIAQVGNVRYCRGESGRIREALLKANALSALRSPLCVHSKSGDPVESPPAFDCAYQPPAPKPSSPGSSIIEGSHCLASTSTSPVQPGAANSAFSLTCCTIQGA